MKRKPTRSGSLDHARKPAFDLRLTRRRFLGLGVATGAAALGLQVIDPQLFEIFGRRSSVTVPDHTLYLRRAHDMLSLKFDLFNLQIDATQPTLPNLVRIDPTQDSFVVANFWPQSIAEQAFLEDSSSQGGPSGGELVTPPPVLSVLAGPSRLAFKLLAGINSVPLDSQLLAWTSFQPSVVPVATADFNPRSAAELRAPGPTETALELPWRVIMSPHDLSQWQNAVAPVTVNGRTELWHTRLVLGPDRGPAGLLDQPDPDLRTLRAVWALDPDFQSNLNTSTLPAPGDLPFRMPLNKRDRFSIVVNTSVDPSNPVRPARPVTANRLMLSSLGAWLDVQGDWDPTNTPFNNGMEQWRHRATMGRDHYVRVVTHGYAFPFGHPFSLVKITERKFNTPDGGGAVAAYLRQRFFLITNHPDKDYAAPGQSNGGRAMPFRHVTFKTVVTPDLVMPPTQPAGLSIAPSQDMFVPQAGNPAAPIQFHILVTDWAGVQSTITTPIIFVSFPSAFDPNTLNVLLSHYGQPDSLFRIPFGGRQLHLAATLTGQDTAVEAQNVVFGAEGNALLDTPTLQQLDQPPFYPTLLSTQVRLKAAEHIKGQQLDDGLGNLPTFKIAHEYISSGFGGLGNPGQLFGAMINPVTGLSASIPFQFGGPSLDVGRAGGLTMPNFSISGLSRAMGPVSVPGVNLGTFDPSKFFDNTARFLGGLSLPSIIGAAPKIDPAGPAAPEHMKIKNELIFGNGRTSPPTADKTTLDWSPPLQQDPLHIFNPQGSNPHATIHAVVVTDLVNPGLSDYQVTGEFLNFQLKLFGDQDPLHVIDLQINRLTFKVQKGKKASVDVDLGQVTFAGVFRFVDDLRNLLKSIGSGPYLDVTQTGVRTGYRQSIPTVSIGAFSLQHIQLSADLNIPFTGKPARFRFDFCTRANPFLLTITFLGGGGWFGLALGSDGFEMIEASLEFGAATSINLGVASGGVHIMAGIYFKLEVTSNGQQTTLTGFLRMGGELSVLGIISVTVEFYMGFTYEQATNKVTGQATLTVAVKVLFFSTSVQLHVERKFGGSGDPNFLDAVPDQTTWNTYCAAFAPAA